MAKSLNMCVFIGRLVRDPEMKTSEHGLFGSFDIAVNDSKKVDGEWVDDPMYLRIKVADRGDYGKLATTVDQYCKKGMLVSVSGRLKLEKWEKDGEKRQAHCLMADAVQFLETKAERESGREDRGRERSKDDDRGRDRDRGRSDDRSRDKDRGVSDDRDRGRDRGRDRDRDRDRPGDRGEADRSRRNDDRDHRAREETDEDIPF